tara:strand:+ start:54 stop:668 length:615 start_codon:yes stop_codon:yes gene_type:complete
MNGSKFVPTFYNKTMRGFRFFRLSQLIGRLFGPKVAEFFDNFGFYFVIAFFTILALILIYLWFDFFKDIVRRLRKKPIQPEESVEEISINLKKESLRKFFIVLLILIILIFVVGLILSNQVDCQEVNLAFIFQRDAYLEELDQTYFNQIALKLVYVNELILLYEEQMQFIENNQNCNSPSYGNLNEILIALKAAQIRLIADLNN